MDFIRERTTGQIEANVQGSSSSIILILFATPTIFYRSKSECVIICWIVASVILETQLHVELLLAILYSIEQSMKQSNRSNHYQMAKCKLQKISLAAKLDMRYLRFGPRSNTTITAHLYSPIITLPLHFGRFLT